jgi:tetratricopeptide (TPR) repeat protein
LGPLVVKKIVSLLWRNRTGMLKHHDPHAKPGIVFAFLLLLFLIFTVYSNTFQSSWHFDDIPNILRNYRLHLVNLNPDSLFKTFFAHPTAGHKIYRPLVTLSFGLNWYFGQANVIGYHGVNTLIHFLTGFILYLTIICLFQTPNIKDTYRQDSKYFIALLSSVLWAINPIQSQAVVYIVQRMALMAGLFYILSIYFYVKVRLSLNPVHRILLLLGCFFSFVFALGSKENAATLPLALLLVEVAFFQDLAEPETRKKIIWIASIGALFLIVVGGILLYMGGWVFLFKGYTVRPFTLAERLMTEPRVLVFYLSQIFFPLPGRLSFLHEIGLSTSLFKPWTTIPAVLVVFILIGFGFSQIRRRPFLAFGILFFFLNHLIESTIIPLELIFEHRNYLPSLFLLVSLASGLKWLIDYYNRRDRYIYSGIVVLVSLLLVALGSGTYIRNKVWATEKYLWLDAMVKAPGYARPYHILAAELKKIGRLDDSIKLYQKALSLKSSKPKHSRSLTLNNIGNIHAKKQEYETAIELYEKALDAYPGNERALYNLTVALINTNRLDEASQTADILVSKWYYLRLYLNLKGFILLKQKKPEKALPYLRSALRSAPNHKNTHIFIGAAFGLSGRYDRAEWFFMRANALYPNDMLILLCLADNSLKGGKIDTADIFIDKLLSEYGNKKVEEFLIKHSKDNFSVPLAYGLLIPEITKKIEKRVGEFTALSKILTESN